MRWLLGGIADWTELFKQAYASLKPGGYVESFELGHGVECDDGTVAENSALGQWTRFFVESEKKTGRSFRVLAHGLQKKGMEEAGFVDIQEMDSKASATLNARPRRRGRRSH